MTWLIFFRCTRLYLSKKYILMENLNLKNFTTDLIKEYIKARTEGILSKAADKISSAIAMLLAGMLLFTCTCCTIFFASFTAAFSLSNYIGKPYIGFLAVCGF